jgi:hypothetical protein
MNSSNEKSARPYGTLALAPEAQRGGEGRIGNLVYSGDQKRIWYNVSVRLQLELLRRTWYLWCLVEL